MPRNNFAYLSLFFSGKDWTELLLYLDGFMEIRENGKLLNTLTRLTRQGSKRI